MSAWTCTGRRGSWPPATAARCWFRRRRARWSTRELADLGEHRLKDFRAGVDLPAGGGALSAAEDDLEHEPAAAGVVVRRQGAGGIGRRRAAAGWSAAGDAVRPGRSGKTGWRSSRRPSSCRSSGTASSGSGSPHCATRPSSPRPSRRRWGPRTVWPSTSASASCSCCWTTSSRWSRRRPSSLHCSSRARTSALLVTSRELLRIQGEVEYPVPPLAQPEAVKLFCARSRAAIRVTTIAELCRRLDNLPLAVELAAARTRSSPPPRSWNVSRSGSICSRAAAMPSRASRHCGRRSLGATSSSLRRSRRLFARFSVFVGGCTLEAADTVCGAGLDVLQSLVDKSLVRIADGRFWMLETIREFALERLEETGGAEELRRRHSAYFLELAELAKPELEAWSSSIWLDRLQAEHDNIRAVLGDALEHGRAEVALRLGGAISHFWLTRGYWSEGRRWLESALAAEHGERSTPSLRRALGRRPARRLAGGHRAGQRRGGRALALATETDSTRARALAHIAGLVADARGDWDHAAQLYAESARLARELGDSWLLSIAVNNLGDVALNRGEYERALELFEESLAIGRELQDQDLLARAFMNLGFTTLMLGDVQRARSLLRDALIAAREIGHVEGFIYGFVGLGAAYAREDPARAARLLGRADMLCEETASDLEAAGGSRSRRDRSRATGEAGRGRLRSGARGGARTPARGRAGACPPPGLSWSTTAVTGTQGAALGERRVQVDPHAVRVTEQRVPLAPERVPRLFFTFEARRDHGRVQLVDFGGAGAFKRERHLIAVRASPLGQEAADDVLRRRTSAASRSASSPRRDHLQAPLEHQPRAGGRTAASAPDPRLRDRSHSASPWGRRYTARRLRARQLAWRLEGSVPGTGGTRYLTCCPPRVEFAGNLTGGVES